MMETVFRDLGAFEPSYVPRDFICREGELREIALCLEPASRGYQAVSARIHGAPATGKTTAVRIMFRRLMERTRRAACAYVCSSIYDSKFTIFDRIHRSLGLARASRNFDAVYEAVFRKIRKGGKSLVVALDDVNFLDAQTLNEVLLAILKGNEEFSVPASVIVISSSPSFGAHLRSQVTSIFSPREIFFRPYRLEEVEEILRQRCRYGFIPGAISRELVARIAFEAHRRKDLRLGIRLLKESGLIAEKEGSVILEEHVEKAVASTPAAASRLKGLSRAELELLRFVCGRGEVTSGEVYRRFDGSTTTHWRRLRKMEKLGLLEVEVFHRRGRSSRIRCACRLDLEELMRTSFLDR